jgi:hypothetical protein
MQWLHSGCRSLHLILLLLQLKQPRRDFVCPFLGIGFLGNGARSVLESEGVPGESLDVSEWSILLRIGSNDEEVVELGMFVRRARGGPCGDIYNTRTVMCRQPAAARKTKFGGLHQR